MEKRSRIPLKHGPTSMAGQGACEPVWKVPGLAVAADPAGRERRIFAQSDVFSLLDLDGYSITAKVLAKVLVVFSNFLWKISGVNCDSDYFAWLFCGMR